MYDCYFYLLDSRNLSFILNLHEKYPIIVPYSFLYDTHYGAFVNCFHFVRFLRRLKKNIVFFDFGVFKKEILKDFFRKFKPRKVYADKSYLSYPFFQRIYSFFESKIKLIDYDRFSNVSIVRESFFWIDDFGRIYRVPLEFSYRRVLARFIPKRILTIRKKPLLIRVFEKVQIKYQKDLSL